MHIAITTCSRKPTSLLALSEAAQTNIPHIMFCCCLNIQSRNLLIPYSPIDVLRYYFYVDHFADFSLKREQREHKNAEIENVEEILCEALHGRTTSGVYCILHCCRSRSKSTR